MSAKTTNNMSIDKGSDNNGSKGLLSLWEIEALPRDYEGYKSRFRDATMRRENNKE